MLITIKNENLEISADTYGAELHSVKLDETEYLWQSGDAWKRYAPILFPFICSPAGRKYKSEGREYTLPANHGFARDSEFELCSRTDSSVTFKLESDSVTKQWYPYDFRLLVTYRIDGKKVEVSNTVQNIGLKDMYFYLGGHPAFICDIESGKCVVEYEQPETVIQPVPAGERTVLDNERILPLNRTQFDYDVIMKDKPDSKSVTLKKEDGGFVKLSFPDSDCIAVWTATGNPEAQFICLEPWTSVPAYADDEFEDIEKKPHAIRLAPDNTYFYSYTIEVG